MKHIFTKIIQQGWGVLVWWPCGDVNPLGVAGSHEGNKWWTKTRTRWQGSVEGWYCSKTLLGNTLWFSFKKLEKQYPFCKSSFGEIVGGSLSIIYVYWCSLKKNYLNMKVLKGTVTLLIRTIWFQKMIIKPTKLLGWKVGPGTNHAWNSETHDTQLCQAFLKKKTGNSWFHVSSQAYFLTLNFTNIEWVNNMELAIDIIQLCRNVVFNFG